MGGYYIGAVRRESDAANAPGQFVEVGVDRSRVLLNRPISIYNRTENTLELLICPCRACD